MTDRVQVANFLGITILSLIRVPSVQGSHLMHYEVCYFCFDGDKIGEQVQLHLMDEDLDGALDFASQVDAAMNQLSAIMEQNSAQCLFRGGDSLIFRSSKDIPDEMIPYKIGSISFSVGVGSSLQLAALGLFKAKASGRGRVGRVLP